MGSGCDILPGGPAGQGYIFCFKRGQDKLSFDFVLYHNAAGPII